MNFPGRFIEIDVVDVTRLRELVAGISDSDWALDVPGRNSEVANPDLQSVALVYDPDLRHTHPTRLPLSKTFEPALTPALKLVADHFEGREPGKSLSRQFGLGYFIRATLERLKAGGTARLVPERTFSQVHSHRIQVPLVTNPDAAVTLGSESRHLAAGHVCEINNRREGTVINGGETDRVHLVLDFVLRGENCCCGARRHPGTVCSPGACRETDRLEIACTCFADEPAA